ncbi:translation initiation factor IF-1 [Candidatus Vidania fulgoroideorum]
MNKKDLFIFEGIILKNLPNSKFLVFVEKIDKEIFCYISGKIRLNYIRIIPGDKVKIEVNKKCSEKGRIIYRIR